MNIETFHLQRYQNEHIPIIVLKLHHNNKVDIKDELVKVNNVIGRLFVVTINLRTIRIPGVLLSGYYIR